MSTYGSEIKIIGWIPLSHLFINMLITFRIYFPLWYGLRLPEILTCTIAKITTITPITTPSITITNLLLLLKLKLLYCYSHYYYCHLPIIDPRSGSIGDERTTRQAYFIFDYSYCLAWLHFFFFTCNYYYCWPYCNYSTVATTSTAIIITASTETFFFLLIVPVLMLILLQMLHLASRLSLYHCYDYVTVICALLLFLLHAITIKEI